ncbi:MAG: hypothetical protein WD049_01180 [Candidatus Paceibacterota bacterium]
MLASMLVCWSGERGDCTLERLSVAQADGMAGRKLAWVPAANTASNSAFSQGGGSAGLLRRLLDLLWGRQQDRRQGFGTRGSPAGIAASLPGSMCAAMAATLPVGRARVMPAIQPA